MLQTVFMMKRTLMMFAVLWAIPLLAAQQKPNVLFIAVDDLNHYVGFMGRNRQAKTPNIDRLAAMGTAFSRAYCTAPACNPSRASLMSGRRPSTSGLYKNKQLWKEYIQEGQGLNHHFRSSGYKTLAMGKIYHQVNNSDYASGWDEYPDLPVGQSGGASKMEGFTKPVRLNLRDEDIGDWHTVNYCIEQLQKGHEKPFFLACGLYKPHLSWTVPRKYYDLFPLEEIELPPHREDDLDDIPPAGMKMIEPSRWEHKSVLASNRWKKAIRSYLATCAYTDMNIGRLLDALEESAYRDNTIIVLWGDHGWSLGEKERWQKFALWEEPTRTPLIWVAPGMTEPGIICDKPVDLLSIYPTLCDLSGLPIPDHVEGESLIPLLKNAQAEWNTPAISTYGAGNHAVRTERWRYIRYANGDEELYDHSKDEYEYDNLAGNPEYSRIKAELAAQLPTDIEQ